MTELIHFYWQLLLRRLPMMLAVVALAIIVAIGVAASLPNSYQASARLLVEAPQIPDELATSTVNIETTEQLGIIQQRLLSRPNLVEVANKFAIFEGSEDVRSPEEIAAAMREMTSIVSRARRGQATFVDIDFTADDPELAAAVVNDFVTRILDDNVRLRMQQAGNTLGFFEQEVERLSSELALQSGRISAFKAENSDTLPEALNFRLSRQTLLEERLAGLRRELSGLDEQRERVISVFQQTGQVQSTEAELTPEQRQLRDLETQLASALAIYSETNPRVAVLRTRIEQLERVVASQAGATPMVNPSSSIYEVTLAELDAQSSSLEAQIEDTEDELAELREKIAATPQTAIQLESLDRDYRNVQRQYDAAVQRLATARTGEQIELTAQGQRISIVEGAVPPEWPSSPNRKIIVAAGGLAGVAIATAVFALLEIVNSTIRRPGELVSKIGITPLATIPYIPTRRQRIVRRAAQVTALLLFFVVTPAAIFVVDRFVMPVEDVVQLMRDLI